MKINDLRAVRNFENGNNSRAPNSTAPVERRIISWLTGPAMNLRSTGDIWHGLCELLHEADLGLQGAVLEMSAIHPVFYMVFNLWKPRHGWECWYLTHDDNRLVSHDELFDGDTETQKPYSNSRARNVVEPCIEVEDFVTEEELSRSQIVLPLKSIGSSKMIVRFLPPTDEVLLESLSTLIKHIVPVLAVVLELQLQRRRSQLLLRSYVGEEPAKQILDGQIKRGDISIINAAIMTCDLRNFTQRANTLPSKEVVALLNRYFDFVVPIILKNDGEVLKYIGDGILAIFPANQGIDSAKNVCTRALRASELISSTLIDYNSNKIGLEHIDSTIALHYGNLAFGNIGSGSRLDFTAIGPDVNLVARIESLSKDFGSGIFMSREFAALIDEEITEVGCFAMKGFEQKQTVFRSENV